MVGGKRQEVGAGLVFVVSQNAVLREESVFVTISRLEDKHAILLRTWTSDRPLHIGKVGSSKGDPSTASECGVFWNWRVRNDGDTS